VLGLGKYLMRISEIVTKTIKPKPPMNPAQARIHGLKQGVEQSRQRLKQEQERQRQQRENERRQKQLQQR
jgi:ribosomal protein S5